MARKGLSKEKVMEEAIEFIEEEGFKNFSIRELAARLNIKAASLYNYIDSMDELNRDIALKASSKLKKIQEEAILGKQRDEALIALAMAYRKFVLTRPQLYKVIMQLPYLEAQKFIDTGGEIIEPLMSVLAMYKLNDIKRMQYQRILRSIIHGFADLEAAGYFAHFPVNNDESYQLAINGIIRDIKTFEE